MSNWAVPPAITTAYASLVALFRDRDNELAVGMDPARVTITSPLTYTIRWNSASNKHEVYNGASWVNLSAGYAISITGTAGNITGIAAAANGGTGFAAYGVGDILTAGTTTTLAKIPDLAVGNALLSGGAGVVPFYGKIGLTTHVSGILPVANGGSGVDASTGSGNNVLSVSPTFTGTPVAPTAAADVNTTQLATTAFVVAQASAVSPLVNGSVTIGTSLRYSRQDHVHPIDTSRAAAGAITSAGLTMAPNRLLGRTTSSTGAAEEITVGSGLTFSGGVLSVPGGGQYQAAMFNVGGTWTCPAGVTRVKVTVIGGGGGGSAGKGGGGGGNGGYACGVYTVTPSTVYGVTVAVSVGQDVSGGSSAFSSFISASGGYANNANGANGYGSGGTIVNGISHFGRGALSGGNYGEGGLTGVQGGVLIEYIG